MNKIALKIRTQNRDVIPQKINCRITSSITGILYFRQLLFFWDGDMKNKFVDTLRLQL